MNGGGNQGGAVPDEVDRLIEAGLEQYGQGDVNGALLAWERALAIDPDDVRASAYVDYVRENYEVLAGTPRADQVPLGLGSPALDDDAYEIELSSPGRPATEPPPEVQDVPLELAAEPLVAATVGPRSLAEPVEMDTGAVERYIESVDEGWFLDDEPIGPGRATVTTSPGTVTDPGRRSSAPARQLPLPANPSQETNEEITLELEADEPDLSEERPLELELAPPGATHGEEERTSAFRNVAWHTSAELDFGDQRSAVPTQEIAAPRGFVRARVEPLVTEPAPSFETEDDRLLTRPGRSAGGPLDPGAIPHGVAPEALAALGPSHQGRRADPDELTRESPFVRVTFNPDTQDLTPPPAEVSVARSQRETLDLEPPPDADDERTSERSAIRVDTSTERTLEREFAGRSYTRPEPLDEATGVPSGRHPPLVIIDDPVLAGGPEPVAPEPEPDAGPPPVHVDFGHELGKDGTPSRRRPGSDRHRAPTADPAIAPPLRHDDLSPGTHRMRRPSAAAPSLAPTVTIAAIDEISHKIDREVEADADPAESRADRTRRRVAALIDRAVSASAVGNHADAIVALDLALSEEPDSAIAQKLLHRHQPAIHDIYQRFLGDLGRRPHLAMPMHELSGEKLDIRAAFLLSRIDGNLSFEEILDVSGMQRGEAFRHLANLILRGILTIA